MPTSDIYQERNLLRVDDYEFLDGEGSRDKYLIVLNRSDDSAFIIHTLTTKQAKGNNPETFGCKTKGNLSYFFIPKRHIIGESGFYFELDTFIFFTNNIIKQSIKSFSKYEIEFKDVVPKAVLKQLIDCMLNSSSITMEQADYLRKTRNRF